MAGHDAGTQYKFTGMSKYFNSLTLIGRRNCVIATYATLLTIGLVYKLRPKKQAAVTEKE